MNQFSMNTTNFYRHSGKAPLLGLILIGMIGFIATPILGLIYGYLIFYIPYVYLDTLLVIGYAFVISSTLNKAIKWGKVRNTFLVGLAGFGFGLLADYIGWVAWMSAFAKDPSYLLEFFLPWDVFAFIVEIGRRGVWSLNGSTPTGGFLYLIWFIEAITVVGVTTYLTLSALSEVPFCEDSDAWVEKKKILAFFAPLTDARRFKSSIAEGNFSVFNELKLITSGNTYTMVELYECETCKNLLVLNVKDVKVTINRRRRNQQVKTVVKNLLITQSMLSGLKRMIQEQQTKVEPRIPPQ